MLNLHFREKLPRYDIDTSFMFPIKQDSCEVVDYTFEPDTGVTEPIVKQRNKRNRKGKGPLKPKRRNRNKPHNQL